MKKPRLRLLYEEDDLLKEIPTDRAKRYFTFTPKKHSFENAPTEKNGRYIDRNYLYGIVDQYDGIVALVDGNKLKGVFGNRTMRNGKIIIQTEYLEGVYRQWEKKTTLKRIIDIIKGDSTGEWKLGKTKSKTEIYQPIYTFEHELGHAICSAYNIKDKLHQYISDKDYEGFWDYVDEELKKKKETIKFHKATHKWLGTWRLTQPFGVNTLPIYRQMGLKGHNGLDFASPIGWKMYFNVETPNDITWTCYNYEDHYGKKVVSISDEKVPLKDGEEYVGVIHLHIRESKVKDGQKIKFGDYFAITGNTGFLSTGTHTHEALKITDSRGYAKNKDNGYRGAINHYEYYL